MDIYYYGHSCFKIKGKTASVIVDPYGADTGLKLPKDMTADVAIKSHEHSDHNNVSAVDGSPLVVAGPGEYEVKGVGITGVGTFHDNKSGEERGVNTVYNILVDGVNVVHLGDLGHTLSDEQVQSIGNCDILMVPIGGVYTIDAEEAVKVVASLEPKIVIPMHFGVAGLKYELEGAGNFLKEMGAEAVEPQGKLTVTKDKLPDETQVVLLSKS